MRRTKTMLMGDLLEEFFKRPYVAAKVAEGKLPDTWREIVGHADQQTGTKAGNKRVAEHRAKRVFDFLVSKGVNPKQLNYEGKGNSPDPFKKVQAANRAAIIQ